MLALVAESVVSHHSLKSASAVRRLYYAVGKVGVSQGLVQATAAAFPFTTTAMKPLMGGGSVPLST